MKPDVHHRPSLADIRINRRTLLHGGGTLATLIAAAAISDGLGSTVVTTTTEPATTAVSRLFEEDSSVSPYEKYIYRAANGEFTTTERKELALKRIRIEPRDIYVPVIGPNGEMRPARNRLVIFNIGKPQQNNTSEEIVSVDPKEEFYGLEIAGATYADGQGLGATKIRKRFEDPEEPFHTIGRWFLLTNAVGQTIDRQGRYVYYSENFVYVSADQTVILTYPQTIPSGQK